ncbi:MAG TPA: prepilin peptidase [Sphingomonas sp.]|nr:prepilin peptidase [Sphingomonas sp.]
MGWGILPLLLLGALALLLVSVGLEDVRTREIANWKNAAIAIAAPLWWVATGIAPWPDMAIQFGLAAFVFGVFALIFAAGWMGGGDVKLIGALALWFPLQPLLWVLVVMSLAGGGITLALAIEHRLRRAEAPLEIPYGVAIAIAGLLALREPLLNQFNA